MNSKLVLSFTLLASVIGLGACGNMSRRDEDTAIGAGVGAIGGSILTGGSAVGTVGGAVIGGVIGDKVGKEKK